MAQAIHTAPDWRTEADYRLLAGLDWAGLAWEWLRRDPTYVAASAVRGCRHSVGVSGAISMDATEPSWSARWGIHFRGTAGSACSSGTHSLACGC